MTETMSGYLSYFTNDIHVAVGILTLGVALFGWWVAYNIRRPLVFRIKLATVYGLPFMLALSYLSPHLWIPFDYKLLLFMTFVVMLNILYWREIKSLTTSIGYHKNVLVNFLDRLPDMVWMKDVEGRFTYTNKAMRDILLLCSSEEAFGKTEGDIAAMHHAEGKVYEFGDLCCDSDKSTLTRYCPCRFLETGEVDGRFLALQVFKVPLVIDFPNGTRRVIGTIGMGRDLTAEYHEHEAIEKLVVNGDISEALKAFQKHKERYECSPYCSRYQFRERTGGSK